jgi:hypothetical protein
MLMKTIRTLLILTLALCNEYSKAEELAIYIADEHIKDLSVEMVVGTRLDLRHAQEDIGIVYYSLGKKLAAVDVPLPMGGLKGELEAARAKTNAAPSNVGPFFRKCDEYIVKDSKGQWFLMQYEFDPGSRYRFCPLNPLSKREELFLASGYLKSSFGVLNAELAKLTRSPENLARRKRLAEPSGAPGGFTQGEQGDVDQPATAPESKPENKEKPKPESKVLPQ